jgi:hypothetical protein
LLCCLRRLMSDEEIMKELQHNLILDVNTTVVIGTDKREKINEQLYPSSSEFRSVPRLQLVPEIVLAQPMTYFTDVFNESIIVLT